MSSIKSAFAVGAASAYVALAGIADAQESRLRAELRREAEHLRESCGSPKTVVGCAVLVATGKPLHLAIGSIAPGNGLSLGAAFGTHYAPSETWRVSWSADAVRSFKGAWRAGGYVMFVRTPEDVITVVTDPTTAPAPGALVVRPSTVFSLYGQTTSLGRVEFFGLGPDSSIDERTEFGLRHTVVGGNVVAPISSFGLARALNLSLLGEAHGRIVAIRDGASDDVPFVGDVFTETTAPGLTDQPNVLQIGEGARLRPDAFGGRLRFNYLVRFQQFFGEGVSFRRWRIDLDHEIPLYGRSGRVEARDTNDPNSCSMSGDGGDCPPLSVSRDRRGSVGLRAVYMTSSASGGNVVPFYLQPTLGGSDVNGQASLSGFDDYRFRGPHAMHFQESIEHSVWGPVGAWVQLEQGMVGLRRAELSAAGLRTSVAAGVTVRAGGFPMVVVSLAHGAEGNHFSATINTSLLGGSARPRLD